MSPTSNEDYLMVLEDSTNRTLWATGGVLATLVLDEPFFQLPFRYHSHRLKRLHGVQTGATPLQIFEPIDFTGCSGNYRTVSFNLLKWKKDFASKNGQLLLKHALCSWHISRTLTEKVLLLKCAGVTRWKWVSLLWESLGRHFFSRIDFKKRMNWRVKAQQFIAELIRSNPVYVNIAPKEQRCTTGALHQNTVPARRLTRGRRLSLRKLTSDIFDWWTKSRSQSPGKLRWSYSRYALLIFGQPKESRREYYPSFPTQK